MVFMRITLLLSILFLATAAYPAAANYKCGTHKEVLMKQLADGYAFVATAITDRGLVIQMFLNLNTGRFRFLGVDENGKSCVVLAGQQWNFIMMRVL